MNWTRVRARFRLQTINHDFIFLGDGGRAISRGDDARQKTEAKRWKIGKHGSRVKAAIASSGPEFDVVALRHAGHLRRRRLEAK